MVEWKIYTIIIQLTNVQQVYGATDLNLRGMFSKYSRIKAINNGSSEGKAVLRST